ncbi:hypothetical protein XM73_c11450 [Vibrio vulnificus]|nr:hypothetical protein XM73_c11450 [Vibrio vulnificus]
MLTYHSQYLASGFSSISPEPLSYIPYLNSTDSQQAIIWDNDSDQY